MKKNSCYKVSGVDIETADKTKYSLGELVRKTFTEGVVGDFGGFGSLFSLKGLRGKKLLVSSADGVGTKLKVAFMAGRHDTVGQDLVNHLVNDILCMGAKPLFFLDYIGTGKIEEETIVSIVRGIAQGCLENGCALLGGETAQMPGFYADGEYDLAGFMVGITDSSVVPDKRKLKPGDILIGFSSRGLHTNGYSLARRAFFEMGKMSIDDIIPETGAKVVDELLSVHRSYLKTIYPFLRKKLIKGLAHITGGGFEGNISRILSSNVDAIVKTSLWNPPGIFRAIQKLARVDSGEMYRVFNMGIGIVAVVSRKDFPVLAKTMKSPDCEVFPIGELVGGTGKVIVKI